ncbi:MAG: site-2 protease family protein [Parachlamydiaceae bacterium]
MTIVSILYVILAILGLSFLIFIHELGHYYMALRLGMRVETFSIGFGKPIFSWMKDGARWQIGWLLFGGYVKIAGMETGDQRDPYEVKDGFFGKSPLDRIKVAFMGPFVNIVFALFAFAVLWGIGGRQSHFSDHTRKIGWIDPKSELFAKGIRPGDEIASYNGQPFESAKDHVSAPMISNGDVEIKGYVVDSHTKKKMPFSYHVKPYQRPNALDKDVVTTGVLHSANYVIYGNRESGEATPLPEGSPMVGSGIEPGDRIVWVDGFEIYSLQQLAHILNEAKALVTIQRGQDVLLRLVPRVPIEELKLTSEVKEELVDWQFESQLQGTKIQKLYYIPYNLNNEALVEGLIKFIDQDKEGDVFTKHPFSSLEQPLEPGDRIIAVDGISVTRSYEIFTHIQKHQVSIIVERDPKLEQVPSWEQGDQLFEHQYKWEDLHHLISQIGLASVSQSSGNLVLLNPVVPKMLKDFQLSNESQAKWEDERQEQYRAIDNIEDPETRAHARSLLESRDKQMLLGLPAIQDGKVQYNPNPFALFKQVFEEIWHTLKALVTGSLNPKWMSGPIGIVQVVHTKSMMSLKEALFWLGSISLNLGFLNLLPLPVLDGGTICFSLYELLTGRRLKAKTLEKVIIPFALLLIGFFIFLTYHDLARLFSHWIP